MSRDDRSGEFTAVLGILITFCTLFVLLRCYCKIFIVRSFAADDFFSVVSLLFFLAFSTMCFLGIQHGTGKRRYLIPDEKIPTGMKLYWLCEMVYVVMSFFVKLSIGIFLLRLAVKRSHRIILWMALVSIEVYGIYFFFIFCFQCFPVSFFWTRFTGGEGYCIPPKMVIDSFYGYSAVSCLTDWTFSIVPIFIVYQLEMDRRKKISAALVLAVCALGSTATIIRFPYIKGLEDTEDFLYATFGVAIWSTVEIGIALAMPAAATLRPLFRRYLGDATRLRSSSNGSMSCFAGNTLTESNAGDHEPRYSHSITGGADAKATATASVLELYKWHNQESAIGASGAGIVKTVQITHHV